MEQLHENRFQLLINEKGGGGVLVLKTAWQRNINADRGLSTYEMTVICHYSKWKITKKFKSIYIAHRNVLNIKDQARKQTL